jgi:hypothetical protein
MTAGPLANKDEQAVPSVSDEFKRERLQRDNARA